jgi:argininosuccinate synthase
MAKEKVILAYSGGLDTTAIIPWLKENFDYEVVCVCIDCGQEEELDGLDERAKSCGAICQRKWFMDSDRQGI